MVLVSWRCSGHGGVATARPADPPAPRRAPCRPRISASRAPSAVRHDGDLAARSAARQSWLFVPADVRAEPEAHKESTQGRARRCREQGLSRRHWACWPAGIPLIITRVCSRSLVMQYPTAIFMVQNFMNSLRIICTGRPRAQPSRHRRPELNGESIGHREGDMLVVDTSIPGASPLGRPGRCHHSGSDAAAHRRAHPHDREWRTLEIEYTLTDPKSSKATGRCRALQPVARRRHLRGRVHAASQLKTCPRCRPDSLIRWR